MLYIQSEEDLVTYCRTSNELDGVIRIITHKLFGTYPLDYQIGPSWITVAISYEVCGETRDYVRGFPSSFLFVKTEEEFEYKKKLLFESGNGSIDIYKLNAKLNGGKL